MATSDSDFTQHSSRWTKCDHRNKRQVPPRVCHAPDTNDVNAPRLRPLRIARLRDPLQRNLPRPRLSPTTNNPHILPRVSATGDAVPTPQYVHTLDEDLLLLTQSFPEMITTADTAGLYQHLVNIFLPSRIATISLDTPIPAGSTHPTAAPTPYSASPPYAAYAPPLPVLGPIPMLARALNGFVVPTPDAAHLFYEDSASQASTFPHQQCFRSDFMA